MAREIKKNFKKLASVSSVCGYEKPIADRIEYILGGSHYTFSRDPLGNLIARAGREGGRRVMISAPLDGPGFLVTFIDKNGMLHISAIGSPTLSALPFRRVRSQSGTLGVIIPKKDDKISSDDELLIDIGADSRSEAERSAAIGDIFALACEPASLGRNSLVGDAAGARACAVALIDAAPRIADADCELYLVFTSQSRVGFRGAKTAAAAIKPEVAISLSPICFNGKNHGEQEAVRPSDGIIALARDGQTIADAELYRKVAGKNKICERVSRDALTDASVIDLAALGCASLSLGLPIAHPSTPEEKTDARDVALASDIITELVLSL